MSSRHEIKNIDIVAQDEYDAAKKQAEELGEKYKEISADESNLRNRRIKLRTRLKLCDDAENRQEIERELANIESAIARVSETRSNIYVRWNKARINLKRKASRHI